MNTHFAIMIMTFIQGLTFFGSSENYQQNNTNAVSLFLRLQNTYVVSNNAWATFELQVSSKQENKIALLKEFRPGSNGEPSHQYNIYISRNDTYYYFSGGVFNKAHIPTKSDYRILENGDSLSFEFQLDFSELSKAPLNYDDMNMDFGDYKVFVEYVDSLSIHSKAFNKRIRSNSVIVDYSSK